MNFLIGLGVTGGKFVAAYDSNMNLSMLCKSDSEQEQIFNSEPPQVVTTRRNVLKGTSEAFTGHPTS